MPLKNKSTKGQFPWADFLKRLAAIAIPIALQNLLTTTASMVDTMMVAPLGEKSVGALGLCAQFSSLMFSGYWGFVGGGMLFFSQYYGADDDAGIERSYGLTWLCMMSVAVTFACLAIFSRKRSCGCIRTKHLYRKSVYNIFRSWALPMYFRSFPWQ